MYKSFLLCFNSSTREWQENGCSSLEFFPFFWNGGNLGYNLRRRKVLSNRGEGRNMVARDQSFMTALLSKELDLALNFCCQHAVMPNSCLNMHGYSTVNFILQVWRLPAYWWCHWTPWYINHSMWEAAALWLAIISITGRHVPVKSCQKRTECWSIMGGSLKYRF